MIFGLLLCLLLSLTACEGLRKEAEKTACDRGHEALSRGDYTSAMAAFQDAIRVESDKANGYLGQGIVYLRQGDYYNSVTVLARALDALGNSDRDRALRQDILLYQAEAYSGNEQYDLAREICDQLIEDGQREAQARILRGELSVLDKKTEVAEEDFHEALRIDDSVENYLRIYESYERLGRRGDGADLLAKALEKPIETAEDALYAGRICYVLGDIKKAKEHLGSAMDGGAIDAGLLLAKISLEQGEISDARAVYRTYFDTDEPSVGYNGLVLCDLAEENYRSALSNVEQGLACGDTTAREMLLFNEVITYERMLDFATAKDKLAIFLREYPANRDAIRENLFLQNR